MICLTNREIESEVRKTLFYKRINRWSVYQCAGILKPFFERDRVFACVKNTLERERERYSVIRLGNF